MLDNQQYQTNVLRAKIVKFGLKCKQFTLQQHRIFPTIQRDLPPHTAQTGMTAVPEGQGRGAGNKTFFNVFISHCEHILHKSGIILPPEQDLSPTRRDCFMR